MSERSAASHKVGNGLHRPQWIIGSVLVPSNSTAASRHLAEVVGGEEGNVRPDEELHKVQKPLVGDQSHPEGVVAHDRVMPMIWRHPL
eukprot:CAMPEP_0180430544 /NCGR_PEP_ID=MMETSP1036_2-20121128/7940_1 /TAXON_ID=632150 /ORGANISM="Azadinium spinosum, Strain 3D9" /LENGTH=87 /DNA_ID=CAMNT_0022436281 /DNA_START=513 /DNA_END=776 /DNA_ORIENTATION=-